jgi:hypothetical protein
MLYGTVLTLEVLKAAVRNMTARRNVTGNRYPS